MTRHAVAIAGGGPTGLMLAAELALADVDVGIFERRANQNVAGSRASGLHARSLEAMDQRGIAQRFVAEGTKYPVVSFHIPLDISDFPTRHNYVLGIPQSRIERILADWVSELGVPIHRECEVAGFAQDDDCVDVELADGSSIRAQYLVGCDGGRSVVRKTAGIEFAGWDASTSWLIAEASMREEPPWGFRTDAVGTHAFAKHQDGERARMVLTEPQVGRAEEPTVDDVRESLVAVFGKDFGIHDVTWISRFTDMARQAVAYRERRVLLAGDAAHVHAPLGGHGLNLGVQDAVNLGWKLAQVVKGTSPPSLLDTYHAERHAAGARVLRNTMAHVALRRPDEQTKALGEVAADLLRMDGPRKRMAGVMSQLDLHYDLGAGHPLLGRRMPDLDVRTADGMVRVFSLLRAARPVLLNLDAPLRVDLTPWADRVRVVDAEYAGVWELPVIGAVAAPRAVLIRPDGYVAWVGDVAGPGLTNALTTWFGRPTGAERV